ncbi:MAG TPA: DUF362 domain-containing protein [Candidatus Latescibacteria bacterium]|jgi:uncharacterized protein (DUF362 family)|nr:hypothetical protein [Gemmatimonadaceae bacterium]HJP31883.1 DUF362 domain-containing protein [Candidatus Latescibacterota bacterium]
MMRNRHLSRREFVARMSAAAAALAVGCGSDSNPLTGEVADGGVLPTPDPLPPGMDARVATANLTGYDTAALRTTLRDMVDSLGGFGNLVSAGDKVGIKLNLTGGSGNAESVPGRFGEPAAELFWTHPEIVRVVGEMFKDAGAGRIVLMEAIYDEGSFYNYGFGEVAEALDAEFVDLNVVAPYSEFAQMEVPDQLGRYDSYTMNRALHDLDVFVSLPKAKRHASAGVTHAMKNQVGSIPLSFYNSGAGHRADLHARGNATLVRNFLDINKIRPIHFSVNDAIKTAEHGEGPWVRGFRTARFDTLIAGMDPVAVDSVSTQVMGYDPMAADEAGPFGDDLVTTDNYLRLAEESNMGVHDLSRIQVVDATVSSLVSG